MSCIGQQAPGAALSAPPAIGGIVTVNGARNVPGFEGHPAAVLRRADVGDENRGYRDVV
jgi:hypothetical protein